MVGAGIGGLGTALALSQGGRRVTVVERDATTVPVSPEAAFEEWQRRGAPQARHSHACLARLRNLLRDRAPEVLSELLEAGATELRFVDHSPPTLADHRAHPGDEDLVALACRCTTFEWVLRRMALGRHGVELVEGAVTGLVSDGPGPEGIPRVTGVRLDGGSELRADVVVDASGVRSPLLSWLQAVGADPVPEREEDTGIVYSSRFYRLLPGADPPVEDGLVIGDMGYLKYAVFVGDNRTFSITFAIQDQDRELRQLLRPGPFTAVAALLGATRWPWSRPTCWPTSWPATAATRWRRRGPTTTPSAGRSSPGTGPPWCVTASSAGPATRWSSQRRTSRRHRWTTTACARCSGAGRRGRRVVSPVMEPGAHAAATPGKPACVVAETGETLAYAELDTRSKQLGQLLRSRGVTVGDDVAILMENNVSYLPVAWGPQRSGLYYTAVSDRLTAPEAEYVVNDCGAQALIASYAQRRVAAHLLDTTPNVHTRLMVGGTIEGYDAYEDAIAAMPPELLPDAVEGLDLLYSSGTTGRPRGVRNLLPMAPLGTPTSATMLLHRLYGLDADGVFLSPAPLHHAGPLRFSMAAQRLGATVVVMERFDPLELLRAIEAYRVTHALLVPTMFVRMLKLPEHERRRFDLSSLRAAIHFAAPCAVPVKEQMIEWWGPIVHEFYSATEANGFTSCNSEEWLGHRGTVGRPLMCTAHIVDDAGTELGPGEVGTVWFESEADFEYHNDPEKTSAGRDERGWTTLGDVGYLDADGFLYLTDRKAFTIVSGGENVYPQEAENVLVTHPEVMDAAVFGVPNEDLGEEVKAVVQPVDHTRAGPALEQDLIAYCRERLAPFKCPRSVDFELELPRHPTGKLYKRLLRDRYWEGRESRIV